MTDKIDEVLLTSRGQFATYVSKEIFFLSQLIWCPGGGTNEGELLITFTEGVFPLFPELGPPCVVWHTCVCRTCYHSNESGTDRPYSRLALPFRRLLMV